MSIMKFIKYPAKHDYAVGIFMILLSLVAFFVYAPNIGKQDLARYFIYIALVPWLLTYFRPRIDKANKNTKIASWIFAITFSLSLTFGFSLQHTHTLALCFGNIKLTILWFITMTVFCHIFQKIFLYLCLFATRHFSSLDNQVHLDISNRNLFLIFFITRLPYLIAFYPCLFDYDAAVSISSFSPDRELYDHHPFLVACLQKVFFEIGAFIGFPSLGMAIFSLTFIILASWGLVYVTRVLGRIATKPWIQFIFVAVYSTMPFFPLLNIYVTKDGIFSYALLIYVATLLDFWNHHRKNGKLPIRLVGLHVTMAFLMCFSRHQGIYFIAIQFLFCIYVLKGCRARLSYFYIPLFFIYFIFKHTLFPLWNVAPTSKNGIIGNLFQQSALSYIRHPERFTPEEKKAFESIVKINIDTVARSFSYRVTDPVKSRYRYTPVKKWSKRNLFSNQEEREAILNYLNTWKSTFLKDPYSCMLASANLVRGFFYNGEAIFHVESWYGCPYLKEKYKFYRNNRLYDITNQSLKRFAKTPFTEFVFERSYFTWLFLLCFIILLLRRDITGIIVFMPLFLSICLFFISPTSTFRYSLPLVTCAFLIIVYITNNHNYAAKPENDSSPYPLL